MGNRGTANKFILAAVFVFLIVLHSASVASAKILGCVTEGNDGKCYEYDYELLRKAYAKHLLGSSSPLFSDYSKKALHSFLDDKNGYVEYENVRKAYARALLQGSNFDVDNYTSGKEAKAAIMPAELYVVTLGSDGKVKYTLKVLANVADFLAAVNGAGNAAELESLLTAQGAGVGLDLGAFNGLSGDRKAEALNGVLAKRPSTGFSSLGQFETALHEAIAAVKPAPGDALKAVNAAATAAAMKRALLDYGDILELDAGRYGLTAAEEEALASRLLELKPFASATELQRILHTTVISVRTGFAIGHSRYNYTLTWLLDRQMTAAPQTYLDGGWKNASRSDVQDYLDPYNFVDMEYIGPAGESIRITADALWVRQRPTTQSAQVVDAAGKAIKVQKNEVFAILGRAEAEAGTDPDSKGAWYRIRASGKEGWVCGNYTEVMGGAFSETSLFQFLLLSGGAGSTVADLDKILFQKGILSGTGAAFMQAARDNNINEIFLASLALHETGNGTSRLAVGMEVEDMDNLYPAAGGKYSREARISATSLKVRKKPTTESDQLTDASNKPIIVSQNQVFTVLAEQEAAAGTEIGTEGPWYRIEVGGKTGWICGKYAQIKVYVTVYNMFGIGAYDSNPPLYGSQRAYGERWLTPEAAILGGAKFASENYVNNPSYYQNTLYKMRWNPAAPGTHQYATDIGWAAKQVSGIRRLYDLVDNYTLTFDIPRYLE